MKYYLINEAREFMEKGRQFRGYWNFTPLKTKAKK